MSDKAIEFDFDMELLYEPYSVDEEVEEPIASAKADDEDGFEEGDYWGDAEEGEATETVKKFIKADPRFAGFELGIISRDLPTELAIMATMTRAAKKNDPVLRGKAFAKLLDTSIKGWRGLTPKIMRALLPQLKAEWVTKKEAELEAEGRTDFEFSPRKLNELCMASTSFFAGSMRVLRRCAERVKQMESAEGNVLSSGTSTDVPEEARA